jgi:hypothetical protein
MSAKVRTSPVTLNESTLETNVAAEIFTLFNSGFNFRYPAWLRKRFRVPLVNFSSFRGRKTKLYRLTPKEEQDGGGWDTKIVIPSGSHESRAIFIQFKRGHHSEGNSIAGSIFNLSKKLLIRTLILLSTTTQTTINTPR